LLVDHVKITADHAKAKNFVPAAILDITSGLMEL
jgi:hypothetical protein